MLRVEKISLVFKYMYINFEKKVQKGFTLIDLMISIVIGSLLLIGIAQLLGLSRQMFAQISGLSDLFTTGFETMEYLRSNCNRAGYGFLPPGQANVNATNFGPCNGRYCGSWPDNSGQSYQAYDPRADIVATYCGTCGTGCGVGTGPAAVIPGWKYLGYYYDCGAPSGGNDWRLGAPKINSPLGPNFIAPGGTTPGNCANAALNWNYNATYPDNGIYFMSLESVQQCNISDPNYDQTELLSRLVPYYNDVYSPCNGSNKCYQNGACGYATLCSADPGHNCGGQCRMAVYQYLMPHVTVTTNPNGMGDQLAVIFAIRDGINNIPDCSGKYISPVANPITTVPIMIQNKFQVAISATSGLPTLQCQSMQRVNGSWSVLTQWTDIVPNIEYFRVMLGLNDNIDRNSNTASGFSSTSVNRYVATPIPSPVYTNGAWANTTADPNRILSIRLAFVARSGDALLPAAQKPTLTLFPSSTISPLTPITYTPQTADRLLRKVFTTTIFLDAFLITDYPPHCVAATGGSGNYYIKIGGIPWLGSVAPSDVCCGNGAGSCYYYPNFTSCESSVSIQQCQSYNQPH